MRAHGVDAITAVDEQHEAVLRKLLADSDTRDVDALRREHAALRRREIEADVHARTLAEWKQTPAYRQAVEQYADIRDLHGQEAASRFWQGVQPEFQSLLQPRLTAALAEHQSSEAVSTWTRNVWGGMANLPQTVRTLPGFRGWFDEAVRDFDAQLAQGAHPDAHTADALAAAFRKHFAARLLARPEVAAVYRRAAAQQRYERERAAQHAAPAAPEAGPLPPAAPVQRTTERPPTPAPTNTGSLKRQVRMQVWQDAQARINALRGRS